MCNIPCPFSAPLCPTPPAESSLPSRPPPDSAGVSHAGHTLPPLTYTDTPGSTPSPHDEDARPWTVPRSSSHLHLHPLPPEETHPTPKDKGAGASLDGTENGDRQKACAPAPVARPVDRRLEGVEEGATRAPELHFRRGEGHRIDLVAHLERRGGGDQWEAGSRSSGSVRAHVHAFLRFPKVAPTETLFLLAES